MSPPVDLKSLFPIVTKLLANKYVRIGREVKKLTLTFNHRDRYYSYFNIIPQNLTLHCHHFISLLIVLGALLLLFLLLRLVALSLLRLFSLGSLHRLAVLRGLPVSLLLLLRHHHHVRSRVI